MGPLANKCRALKRCISSHPNGSVSCFSLEADHKWDLIANTLWMSRSAPITGLVRLPACSVCLCNHSTAGHWPPLGTDCGLQAADGPRKHIHYIIQDTKHHSSLLQCALGGQEEARTNSRSCRILQFHSSLLHCPKNQKWGLGYSDENVYGGIVRNGPKAETSQGPIKDHWINQTQYRHARECYSAIKKKFRYSYIMDKPRKHSTQWKKLGTKGQIL